VDYRNARNARNVDHGGVVKENPHCVPEMPVLALGFSLRALRFIPPFTTGTCRPCDRA